jgi:hypothetical protein
MFVSDDLIGNYVTGQEQSIRVIFLIDGMNMLRQKVSIVGNEYTNNIKMNYLNFNDL